MLPENKLLAQKSGEVELQSKTVIWKPCAWLLPNLSCLITAGFHLDRRNREPGGPQGSLVLADQSGLIKISLSLENSIPLAVGAGALGAYWRNAGVSAAATVLMAWPRAVGSCLHAHFTQLGFWSSHWASGAGCSRRESCWSERMGWKCSEKPEPEGKSLWAGKVWFWKGRKPRKWQGLWQLWYLYGW